MFYFNGCSFTYGSELDNLSDRYSDVVSKHFNTNCLNQAQGGASNQKIFRETMQAIATHNDIKLVSVMWTELFRFEHFTGDPCEYGTGRDGWRRVTSTRLSQILEKKLPSSGSIVGSEIDEFVDPSAKSINKALGLYATEIRTDKHMIAEFLHMVLQLQTLCKARNIQLINSFAFGQEILKKNANFVNLFPIYELIDRSLWLENNLSWTMSGYNKKLNLPYGPGGHPLAQGHKETAKLFITKING